MSVLLENLAACALAVLWPFLAIYAAFWVCWVLFVAIMRLKMVRDAGALTPGMKLLGYPTLFIGYPLDVALNVVVLSLVLWELPREFTISARLWRWSNAADGAWRYEFCQWLRKQLLDAIDPSGVHRG